MMTFVIRDLVQAMNSWIYTWNTISMYAPPMSGSHSFLESSLVCSRFLEVTLQIKPVERGPLGIKSIAGSTRGCVYQLHSA